MQTYVVLGILFQGPMKFICTITKFLAAPPHRQLQIRNILDEKKKKILAIEKDKENSGAKGINEKQYGSIRA